MTWPEIDGEVEHCAFHGRLWARLPGRILDGRPDPDPPGQAASHDGFVPHAEARHDGQV